jgi:hypothetical protein
MVSGPVRFEARQECEAWATRSHAEPPGTQRNSLFSSPWRPWRRETESANLDSPVPRSRRGPKDFGNTPSHFEVRRSPCLSSPGADATSDPELRPSGETNWKHIPPSRNPGPATQNFCLLPSKSKIADRKSKISQLPQTRPIVTHPGPGLARLSQILDLGR